MSLSKEVKEVIAAAVDETFRKMNDISWLERQKLMKEEAFKNTEKLLYSYSILKEHVADEAEYLKMAEKQTSGSIVKHSEHKGEPLDEEEISKAREASYHRSRADVERIEKALEKIKGKKGYEVIELRYLSRKETVEDGKKAEETYTFEEIAALLAGQPGYSENLNEKTVRGYKNALIHDIAIFLFGSDAV